MLIVSGVVATVSVSGVRVTVAVNPGAKGLTLMVTPAVATMAGAVTVTVGGVIVTVGRSTANGGIVTSGLPSRARSSSVGSTFSPNGLSFGLHSAALSSALMG